MILVDERQLQRLMDLGRQMSNMLYNLRHSESPMSESNKQIADELVKEWDYRVHAGI
jgi:hypothetical protein